MRRASRFAAVATAAFILAITGVPAEAADPCAQAGLQVVPSPFSPWKGAPLRVMAVSEKPLDGTISLTGPDGSVVAKSSDRHGGPPYFWFAEVNEPAAGKWHASLALDRPAADCSAITHEISVSATKPAPVAIPVRKILAGEEQLGSRQRDAVLGLDRQAVRRARRSGSELEGLERRAARQVAQLPRQLSRPQ